jgi:site-specific recombinase XerC
MPLERGYSPHTCDSYAHAFRLLFVFASERLRQQPSQLCLEHIDAALVLDYLAHIEQQRGNVATTRNARLAAIKAFMRYVEYRVPSALEQIRPVWHPPAFSHAVRNEIPNRVVSGPCSRRPEHRLSGAGRILTGCCPKLAAAQRPCDQ